MTAHVRVKPGALVRALDDQAVTVRALAVAADISPALAGFLRREECGTSVDRAERIAEALGKDVNDLFEHKNGDRIGGAS